MNISAQSSAKFGPSPLEATASELAHLLAAGLDDEFARRFQQIAKGMPDDESEALVIMINRQLQSGARRRDVRLVVSQSSAVKRLTVINGSRFWGSSWSIARQTFAY